MHARGILEHDVDEALNHVGATYPSESHPDRTVILGTTITGRELKIVVATNEMDYLITVSDRIVEG